MSTEIAAPAGAAADGAATETVSATVAAADEGNFSAFQEAETKRRSGTPAEKVTRPVLVAKKDGATAVPGKDGQAAKGPTDKDRSADERLTARIREAVDTSTSDLRKQNDDLRRELDGLKKPAAAPVKAGADAAAGADEAKAEYKRFLAMSDAPKLEDFDSVAEHGAAVTVFINRKQGEERATADREASTHFEREKQSIERVKTFHDRINGYKATDPEFAAKLTPEVKGLHGWARLQQINAERAGRGEPAINATVDHAIAEQLYDSDAPAQMAVYLSEHPEALASLRQAKTPQQLIKAFSLLENKVNPPKAEDDSADDTETITAAALADKADGVVDRSVTKANPPAPKVGKAGSKVDPIREALDKGNVGMFLELDRQAMAEKRGLRAR